MRSNIVLFRSVAIIYIYYFYLIGVGVMPNLTAITAACHEDATSRPLELLWGKSSSITTYSI
jgi:hypothetical protein